ncbi:MAG TPA: hypothetical protein VLH60_08030 [Sedimentisphaerales bacterium]|nr:hypothetical protein [Sedimentisphaerales bacterium]
MFAVGRERNQTGEISAGARPIEIIIGKNEGQLMQLRLDAPPLCMCKVL